MISCTASPRTRASACAPMPCRRTPRSSPVSPTTSATEIFSAQLAVLGRQATCCSPFPGAETRRTSWRRSAAKRIGMSTYAVLGYAGGKAKALADVAIHFPVDDMQIAEDLQLVVGHMIMQWLHRNRSELTASLCRIPLCSSSLVVIHSPAQASCGICCRRAIRSSASAVPKSRTRHSFPIAGTAMRRVSISQARPQPRSRRHACLCSSASSLLTSSTSRHKAWLRKAGRIPTTGS